MGGRFERVHRVVVHEVHERGPHEGPYDLGDPVAAGLAWGFANFGGGLGARRFPLPVVLAFSQVGGLAFIAVLVLHLVGSFVAWSLAPGNVVPQRSYGGLQRIAWPIFAVPLFDVLPANMTTTSFGAVLVINSLCVALVIAAIAYFLRKN